MSTLHREAPTTGAARSLRPVLIGLALVFLLAWVYFFVFTRAEIDNEATGAAVLEKFDASRSEVTWGMGYPVQAMAALLVFWAAAVRHQVSSAWAATAGLLGAALVAYTYSTWAVTTLALYHAAHMGSADSAQTLNTLDNSNFLPVMLGMICLYVGFGLAAWTTGTLPRWLAGGSILLGVMAPLGPGGFPAFVLLPVWLVAVSALLRSEE